MASLKELLSYKLRKAADLLGRSASIRYKRLFGVSLLEWRTLALIGEFGPMSLNELADHAALDKSQVSRVIADLARRRLVVRGRNIDDGRGVALTLSASGQRICDKLISEASGRNHFFMDCLTATEQSALQSALAKLTDAGKRLLLDEQRVNPPSEPGQRRRRLR